ncbi:hypothetical protein [uncultured Mediterranean phage uvDeep-CGR2-KM22-C255]|nr:hypothetical protein [uncultured Mediterranean phage uvDeep-CGR2-KM22-C255]
MSYIGNGPVVGAFKKCDAITTSSTATYNLTVSSVAVIPQSANHCIVSLNGVIQAPTSAFTVSGSTIVFNSSLTSSDVVDFILILGDVLNVGTPSDDAVSTAKIADSAVSTAKIADDAITLAKMAAGTDGQIITYDASGNPAAVGPGTDGQVLTSTGAGSPPAFEAAAGGSWKKIEHISITSGSSYVTFDNIPTGYQDLKIIASDCCVTGDDEYIQMELQHSGSTWLSGDYRGISHEVDDSANIGKTGFIAASEFRMFTDGVGNNTNEYVGFEVVCYDYLSAKGKQLQWRYDFRNNGNEHISGFGGGHNDGNEAAITGIRFSAQTNNIDDGEFTLYGRSTS